MYLTDFDVSLQDYMKLEPNPWTVRRIPLVGCRGLTGHGHSHDNTPHNHGNQQHSDRSDRNHSDQQHRNISHGNHGNDVISNEVNPRQGFLSTLLRSDSLLLTQEDHTSRTEEQGEEEREGYEEEDGYEEGAEYEEYEEDLEETGSEYSDMSNTSTDHINSCVILWPSEWFTITINYHMSYWLWHMKSPLDDYVLVHLCGY